MNSVTLGAFIFIIVLEDPFDHVFVDAPLLQLPMPMHVHQVLQYSTLARDDRATQLAVILLEVEGEEGDFGPLQPIVLTILLVPTQGVGPLRLARLNSPDESITVLALGRVALDQLAKVFQLSRLHWTLLRVEQLEKVEEFVFLAHQLFKSGRVPAILKGSSLVEEVQNVTIARSLNGW